MARSLKDDVRFETNTNTWNYQPEKVENSNSALLLDTNQQPSQSVSLKDNSTCNNMYLNTNYAEDVYLNHNTYNVQSADNTVHQNYGNAVLSLDSGHLLRVFVDKNNRQLIFPSNQYELFSQNQGIHNIQLETQPNNPYSLNQEYMLNNHVHNLQAGAIPQNNMYNQDNLNIQANNITTSDFFKEVLGNLEPKPNPTGSYSPFGQSYPLNHPDSSSLNILQNNITERLTPVKQDSSPKRNENSPLSEITNKKRIVAEVKPMRPSYSDVLAKNTKNPPTENINQTKKSVEIKSNIKGNGKVDKGTNSKYVNDESKQKIEKKQSNTISSGSESGDINVDEVEKNPKARKKSKNKRNNMTRKWSSVDDMTAEEVNTYNSDTSSQFIFVEKSAKKDKKNNDSTVKSGSKNHMKSEKQDQPELILEETLNESIKSKKKKEKNFHKVSKPLPEKKKINQVKSKRNKAELLGLMQNYFEHWYEATWRAMLWFFYLLSDICHMSAHLSLDLCTSVFTQTYVSTQAVWRSSKDWLYRFKDNKYLMYIDRKLGHTRFGFWRKLNFFKKNLETENNNDTAKPNTNIPLPATGEEAMKRLLACKGKDPYNILGVSVSCTDEEIKRYYRRQAFLVHPDKNQQPGAEEAFKILQHAFDLIGEPERREAYDRRAVESRHVEAAWSELSQLLAQLQDKMEYAANTIRCTNCGRRHKRVSTDRPCYAARYCAMCKIRHSAKEGDIWAESSLMGLLVMYFACMDGAVYQITEWASCQKNNLRQLRPDSHMVQYRIVLGNKAAAAASEYNQRPSTGPDPNLEEFLNNLYSKSGMPSNNNGKQSSTDTADGKKRRNKKPKA